MARPLRILAALAIAGLWLAEAVVAQDVRLRPLRPIYVDTLGTAIHAPEGVAFNGASRLAVADTGNRRFVLFDVKKDSISPFSEFRLTQVPIPVQVRFDSSGTLLALDAKSHRIARIDPDGTFKSYVEITPASGRRAALVKGFEVDREDNLWVLETAGSRILMLDRAGNLRRTIAFAPEAGFLSDLAVNRSGVVFAVDSVGRRVFVARKGEDVLTPLTETLDEEMEFPTSIVADGEGYLYLSDQSGSGIVVLGESGSFHGRHSSRGRTQGFLWHPVGLDTGGEYLFVADRGNNRVQVFLISR